MGIVGSFKKSKLLGKGGNTSDPTTQKWQHKNGKHWKENHCAIVDARPLAFWSSFTNKSLYVLKTHSMM
jgi:hypothetical protein